jgi:two-component system, sensor histidine kinase and response regulator
MAISRNSIISIIAHDLKDPLISIAGITELLISNADDFSEEEKGEILTEIHDTTETTLRLLNDLLEWSKQMSKTPNPIRKSFNACSIINNNLEPFKRIATRKNISIVNKVPDQVFLYADEHIFAAVIRNLTTNSIKSCPSGGEITITSRLEGNQAEICIRDNGVGIEASRLTQLFSGKNSSSDRQNSYGNGLGLILCRDFVEINGGNIRAESEKGSGTRVYFTVGIGV